MDVNQVLEATLSPGKIPNCLTTSRGDGNDAKSLQTPQSVRMQSNSSYRQLRLTL